MKSVTPRPAFTTMETVIATVLLSFAAVSVSQLFVQAKQSLRALEHNKQIRWEIDNARELIRTWSVADITAANIEQIPLPAGLQGTLTEARWQASVVSLDEPIPAMQVTLAITGFRHEQSVAPEKITFWIPLEASTPAGADDGDL